MIIFKKIAGLSFLKCHQWWVSERGRGRQNRIQTMSVFLFRNDHQRY